MLSEELMNRRRMIMAAKDDSVLYEAFNLSFDGSSYIDTGVYLFTQENINKDFEFIAEGISGARISQNTIVCAKHNGNAYGFLIRIDDGTSTAYNGTISVKSTPNVATVIVKRINGVITLSGTNITNPSVKFTNTAFNWPLVLGCAIDDNGTPFRYRAGNIEHIVVRWL